MNTGLMGLVDCPGNFALSHMLTSTTWDCVNALADCVDALFLQTFFKYILE